MTVLSNRHQRACQLVRLSLSIIVMAASGCDGGLGDTSDVTEDPSKMATLTWDANSETDLAGYKVYHSQESQLYTPGSASAVTSANSTTHVFRELTSGRHYFVVTAYDTSGNESALSEEVFKDIP